ncbi:hypothetical protein COU36_02930 [Candidatus Micrarchaeota archaeon CG10_big_fil_rev_8_21_14_0_10_59_7]|nr:MAG: hypothetical protein COU36_02930 [Candidatus Micrarchaeota archaeon CG10_big_fil_rev_8_21_14_0_10_59_7]
MDEHTHHEHHAEKPQPPLGVPLPILLAVVAILCLVIGFFAASLIRPPSVPSGTPTPAPSIDALQLQSKVATYLTDMLAAQGAVGVVVQGTATTIENGMYAVNVSILQDGQVVQEAVAYVSLDGKSLFIGQVLDFTKAFPKPTPVPTVAIPKTAKPEAEMYVMSFCPYGQQAEASVGPAQKALGDSITVVPHFVIYGKDYYAGQEAEYCMANTSLCSLHGIAEVDEDARQACIWKYQPAKWWVYVLYVNGNCTLENIPDCWKTAANATGVNATAVEQCYSAEGAALLEADAALNQEKEVTGSPTLFINGVTYSGGRAAENFKDAFCAAFTNQPAACNMTLSEAQAAASGSCG